MLNARFFVRIYLCFGELEILNDACGGRRKGDYWGNG